MVEELTPQPEDPYGIAKYTPWNSTSRKHTRCSALTASYSRPHNVYGERQNLSDPYRNVISIFMNKIRNGQPMTVFPATASKTRAFSYISDVAPVIAAASSGPRR